MSVHIPSTLKVTRLNVASTAAVGNLSLQNGKGGSWLLYADTDSTKLIYTADGTSASFVLDASHQYTLNLKVPGVQAELVTADRLVLNGPATIAGTLAADKLIANTLDVSNLDFSDATLNVSSILVDGSATISTLSAVQILAVQGAIEQLTVDDTLTAKSAVLAELTVTHTLAGHTVEAQNKVNAPLIVADRAEFDTLYVNGQAITGSSSGGGSGGGEVTVPMHLTVHTLTANKTVLIPGTQYVNGDIELATDTGIRVGMAGAIEIADAGSDATVRIDRTGVKALKVSASTVSANSLTSSSTVTTQNLSVGNSGTVGGLLTAQELSVSNSINADSAEITTATITDLTSNTAEVETLSAVDILTESISAGSIDGGSIQIAEDAIISGSVQGTNITAFGSVTAPLIAADDIQVGNITATDNLTAASIAATSITTDVIQTSGRAQFDSARVSKDMTIGSRLDVETLYVNGVQITDNGGESELPPTIQVSEVLALTSGKAVSIPQMQGMHLTLSGSMGSLLPSDVPPLVLHVFLEQNSVDDTGFRVTEVTSLRAESGFRAPVTFVSPGGGTQVSSLDEARFTQRTIATACQQPCNGTIDMGDVVVSSSYIYCDRAWLEVCPAGLNSINNEQSTVTLRADRALIYNDNNNAFNIANGEITSSGIRRLNSAAFTLAPEALTARVSKQLPHDSTIGSIYDKVTSAYPADSTPLLCATDIKTEITPSCFKAEATATLLTYGVLADSGVAILDSSGNLKSSIQLDVSPDAYIGTLASVGDVNNPNSGIYVRPNNVIIQAPINPPASDVVPIPANPAQMGIGLFGRNIVLDAESAIKLNTSTSIIGSLQVSNGLTVVGTLSARSLYTNDMHASGLYTPNIISTSTLNLVASTNIILNSTEYGISLITGSTDQSYWDARIAIADTSNIVLDHAEGEKVIIAEHNKSTGTITPSGGTLQLGKLIAGAGETTVIDSSNFNPSSVSGGLKNNKIVIGNSSARIMSCIEWNTEDDLLSYFQGEGKYTCVPIHLLFQIFQLRPELQASTTTT